VDLLDFLSGPVKLVMVSLITGIVFSAINLLAEGVFAHVGVTRRRLALVEGALAWALPNIILGATLILPVRLLMFPADAAAGPGQWATSDAISASEQ
jgi:hypothetical protein